MIENPCLDIRLHVDNRRFINGMPTMRHLWNLARVSVGYFGFCDDCGREAELNRAHVCKFGFEG